MRRSPFHVFADLHTHTRHSHGTGSVLDNVRAAQRQGLEVVAITDHGPASLFGVGVAGPAAFDAIRQEVIEARKAYPGVKVLWGAEANVVSEDGELDIPPGLQERLDIVLAGLHPLVRWRSWAKERHFWPPTPPAPGPAGSGTPGSGTPGPSSTPSCTTGSTW